MITFTVPGVPQVQGNHRVSKHGYTYDTNKDLAPWRRTVALVARQAMTAANAKLITGPVQLDIEFAMPRTKAMRTDPPPPMIQRPDSSKLQRAIEDALTGITYNDDSQITHLTVHKRRHLLTEQPHATITITPAPKGPNHQ
ncbi:RusA family crossover junction endodeoxyribonuclease [Corynebacterium sp. p3-SID1194]|uniref:RusA family crossover junction endodeoxyribonuclease n=1 Tax=Corynebacterium sp. p3-SID1194 TaxID=2916105 RepID=UPI0021A4DDFA|nr:RusA family crossover junction endodeoxyribonuclease [Corynebacterium sp. p3-SID1194]MCT1450633.1 RusA family crossover junction endodeoxyribonuclease [Corynebacterium sp. p3-SID1194]